MGNNDIEIKNKIFEEGLYHITSKEKAEKIIKENKLYGLSNNLIDGKGKSFFFAGIPSYDDVRRNVPNLAYEPEITAIKITLTPEEIKKLLFRKYSDKVIAKAGDIHIQGNAKVVKLGLDINEGNLYYSTYNGVYSPHLDVLIKLKRKKEKVQRVKRFGLDYFNEYINLGKHTMNLLKKNTFILNNVNDNYENEIYSRKK